MAEAAAPIAIEANQLTKIYRGRQVALNDVTFAVERGAVLGLIGPNGAGKSTLLRLLLGLHSPTSGHVKVFGQKMSPGRADLRRRIGYIPTHPRLPRGFTPMTFLDYIGQLQGLRSVLRRTKTASLLRAVGLLEISGENVEGFSHGMAARLMVAASLLNDPDLLIWDEPLHSLDPEARRSMFDLIRSFDGQKTLVLASHHLSDVDEVCTHAAMLCQGHLVAMGPIEEFQNTSECRHFALDLAGDGKSITKAYQTVKGMPEILQATCKNRRLEIRLREQVVNSVALANVFMELASSRLAVVGFEVYGEATETQFLALVGREETRGFARVAAPQSEAA
ncbi:MAG TPA: ABC transporter ATP-binding protein [Gemmatales bacterium]|nr:ABC transporter ATP-binding protein [Gemmatales bacterium]HMP59949.1 ABC transporter ATP-binding protein [Gemmatales bacterium]